MFIPIVNRQKISNCCKNLWTKLDFDREIAACKTLKHNHLICRCDLEVYNTSMQLLHNWAYQRRFFFSFSPNIYSILSQIQTSESLKYKSNRVNFKAKERWDNLRSIKWYHGLLSFKLPHIKATRMHERAFGISNCPNQSWICHRAKTNNALILGINHRHRTMFIHNCLLSNPLSAGKRIFHF